MDGKSLNITEEKLNKLKEIIPEAFKAGYKTIAEIGRERIRRAINKIKEEQASELDAGIEFKVV
ncbi:MAG: hypothetical protein KAR21_10140 [Spirochaetales bacterium]|nr:hypothetical protein [Spirochaetales bacterium]